MTPPFLVDLDPIASVCDRQHLEVEISDRAVAPHLCETLAERHLPIYAEHLADPRERTLIFAVAPVVQLLHHGTAPLLAPVLAPHIVDRVCEHLEPESPCLAAVVVALISDGHRLLLMAR